MTSTPSSPARSAGRGRARRREWVAVLGRAVRTGRGAIGLAVVGVVVLIAAIGPALAPYSGRLRYARRSRNPSLKFPLGADTLGRDVSQPHRSTAAGTVADGRAATALGVAAGAPSASPPPTSRAVGRAHDARVDVFLAFPQIVFALLLVSVARPAALADRARGGVSTLRRWPG